MSNAVASRTLALAIAGSLSLTAAPASPTPPDAQTILRRAEAVRSPDLDYAVDFRLEVTDPSSVWKKRHAEYTLIAHGKDASLVVMREPEPFHPGVLLITNGLYWLLLPRSEKPFQLSPRHVLNGDISNGDLARGNLLLHYEPTLAGEETVGVEPCHVLELERVRNLGIYRRIRAWITKDGFRPKKFEYYGETGALLKVALYEDYREGAIGTRSMRIQVDNQIRPGERSVLTFRDLRRFDSSRLDFSRDALMALRDAFRARRQEDGTQARPEEVVEFLEPVQP